jgi:hypothetical protein
MTLMTLMALSLVHVFLLSNSTAHAQPANIRALSEPSTSPAGRALREKVVTSEGMDFWVCFQRNDSDPERGPLDNKVSDGKTNGKQPDAALDLQLFISAEELCRVTIEIDGLFFKREITVRGGTVSNVRIDSMAQIRSSEKPERLAVHITATKPVSVYGLNHRRMTTDTFMGLPVPALGQEYRIISYEKLRDDPLLISQFAVIATEDSTLVTINPSTQTLGGKPRGVPYTVLLKRGDAYNVIAAPGRRFGRSDLTGTLIQSNKKIAVFGSHSGAYVPQNELAGYNHLVEQLPPVLYWGRHYYVGKLAGCSRSVFRVLAAETNTNVFANGELVATLDAGEYYEDPEVTDNVQISANKRILVAQYSMGYKNGQGKDLRDSIGDPMMLLLTPTQQFLKKYRIATPTRGEWQHFFNVVIPREGRSSLRLNGQPVRDSLFAPFADSRYDFAQIEVPYGTHTLECTVPFGVYSYGFGFNIDNYDAYGNLAGQAFIEWTPQRDTLAPLADLQVIQPARAKASTPQRPARLGSSTAQQSAQSRQSSLSANLGVRPVPSAKVIFHEDRDIDRGLLSVRVLMATGLRVVETPFTKSAPLAAIVFTPAEPDGTPSRQGSAIIEATDIEGNISRVRLCYDTSTDPAGLFSLSEDGGACPSAWHVGALGSFALTSHNASFGAVSGLTTPGRFGNAGATSYAFSGGSALVDYRVNALFALTLRAGLEAIAGRIEAPDSAVSLTREPTTNSIVTFQEGSALSLTGLHLGFTAAAQWFITTNIYAIAGIKAMIPLRNNAVEFKRQIITPSSLRYADGTRETTRFLGTPPTLSAIVPAGVVGAGVVVPFGVRWSLVAEALYTSTFGSWFVDADWRTQQVVIQLGARYRL